MLSDPAAFPCVTRIERVQGPKRKIVYIVSFELIAIVLASTLLRWLADSPVATAGITAAASSAIAMGWNYFYNILFESWEARQPRKGRSVLRLCTINPLTTESDLEETIRRLAGL